MSAEALIGGAAITAAFLHHTIQDLVFHDLGGEASSLSHGLARLIVDKVRLAQGRLPHNHELRDASLQSFRAAAFILGHAVGRKLEADLPLASALLQHIKDRTLFNQPFTEMRHTKDKPKAAWLDRLLHTCKESRDFEKFHDEVVLDDREMDTLLRHQIDTAVQSSIHAAFRKWADKVIGAENQPDNFAEYLDKGFPLEDGKADRITFFQAYCLEFKEHVKHSHAVEAILTTDTLAIVKHAVRSLAAEQKEILARLSRLDQLDQRITSESFTSWLDEKLSRIEGLIVEHGRASSEAHRQTHEKIAHVPTAVADELERRRLITSTFEFKADISRIIKYAPAELIGRESETKLLNDAWAKVKNHEAKRPHILTFVALGGEGKTSLVAKWVAELAAQDWPGCDAAFAWSFYSQGTREQMAASSDLFLKEALTFFGDDADKQFAASAAGAFEKGQRLARIVGQRRSLLILDGLEPLQYAPTSPTPGQLKDQGIAALLKDLAAASHGLCVVTTRYSLPDLRALWQSTAPQVKLLRLSRDAGVHLVKTLGVNGTEKEFETLVEDVKGHALTLILLGGFLKRAFHGDIRQRDRVKFEKADEKLDGGHAFRTMAAYEQWLLRDGGDEGRREVAVLRLMGLFDRPADAGCLHALLQPPVIPGLTEPLVGIAEEDWNFSLDSLESAKLITKHADGSAILHSSFCIHHSLDAHPHLREYFARQLRTQQPDAWRAAHRRLYEHLCATTPDKPQPTLEDLQPLYQAVAHGCQAGLQEEAAVSVWWKRISRGAGYSVKKLGAFGADLGALACLFDVPWKKLSAALSHGNAAGILQNTSFHLRALGRLTEALEPMSVGLGMRVKQEDWKEAAVTASNLSELELTLGEVARAVGDAEQSVTYADRSGDAFHQMGKRTTHADALHQAGRRAEAEKRFREAEQMQKEDQPDYPLLYSLQGFRYCDLLLAAPERASWQLMLRSSAVSERPAAAASPSQHTWNVSTRVSASDPAAGGPADTPALLESCRAVSQRAATALEIVLNGSRNLLDIATNHLTLGCASLYSAILERSAAFTPLQHPNESAAANDDEDRSGLKAALQDARRELDTAVDGLRRANRSDYLPRSLLTRAWLRFLTDARTGPESAQEDLDEAWEIAERGPMKLFLADIHLHRARLFFREKEYPKEWISPQDDLAAAEKLIKACGYYRRDEELADAKQAILGS